MGAEWSSLGYFNPSKRFKRDTDDTKLNENDAENIDNSDENSTELGLFTEAGWNRLPYLVLLEVFQHLDQTDRYHAALTCKSWLLTLSSPSLWNTGHFKFNSKYSQSLISFVNRMGKFLQHIEADCAAQEAGETSADLLFLYQFTEALLTANNQQLVTLSLTNTKLLQPSAVHQWEVVEKLALLIENQQNLQVLDLSHADLSIKKGLRLLEAAASHRCHDTIHTLNINDLITITTPNDITDNARFHYFMSRFGNLSDLQLSYFYVSDELLYMLAITARHTLQKMSLHAKCLGHADRLTSKSAWQCLTSASPQLKLAVFIQSNMGMRYVSTLSRFLNPSLPLHQLHWVCGQMHDEEDIQMSLYHIAIFFENSLRHLRLDFANFRDEGMLRVLIKRCHKLETLSVNVLGLNRQEEIGFEVAIMLGIASHPIRHECVATLNNKDVSLRDTWFTSFLCFMMTRM
ncbi:F-box/LRR-repeat protein 3-like [Physella acuta]|uniref:F-box/LRR-repeat protein 3-like n=1 Tax=Physella acuta TaxID=109671 RepID=UPI0027DC0EAF|nr:F-box/LRR-repeat protein 3-like [Physella acuta]